MITFTVTNRYNQINPAIDIKSNDDNIDDNEDQINPAIDIKSNDDNIDDDDNEEQKELLVDHTHPHKLEDFFTKDGSFTWAVDQSTLDKVQMLIKDIEYFNQACFQLSLAGVFTKIKDEDGNVDEEETQECKEFTKDIENKNVQVLKEDVTLLYNIYSYTNTAFSLPDCKNKPLVKTISELALATLKIYTEKSVDEVSDLIESFLESSKCSELSELIKTIKNMNVNNTNSSSVNTVSNANIKNVNE
jgi:hypothetical protein